MKQLITQLFGLVLLLIQWFNLGPIQRKWLFSLIIHPKRKLSGRLGIRGEEKNTYQACCLGELGLIAKTCQWKNHVLQEIDGLIKDNSYLAESHEKLGLYSQKGGCLNESSTSTLAYFNDQDKGEKYSWPDIAVIILKKPINYLKFKV